MNGETIKTLTCLSHCPMPPPGLSEADRRVVMSRPDVASVATEPICQSAGRIACCLGAARASEIGGNVAMQVEMAKRALRQQREKTDAQQRIQGSRR